ncbi:MAG: FAD-dependent oxidoreductase, partial [Sedimentisphaerales bacterium]|nr:FAD-dependent oxidoreductase [Sedimentisphaerales bacterium]
MNDNSYEVIVVGGGHAGVEAAYAATRLGMRVALVTIGIDTIAQMSCNPAIGGLAKGQIVREIDALGGIMALAIDKAGIQFRMLNRSKGPAVWAPRAQADMRDYQDQIRLLLSKCENLAIIEDTVEQLQLSDDRITGIVCESGRKITAPTVVLTTGTFLRGIMHTGPKQWCGGRYNEPAAEKLSASLEQAGLKLKRLKTGTPARVAAESIDYS